MVANVGDAVTRLIRHFRNQVLLQLLLLAVAQGRGNYFEVGGGGGKRLPGFKVTPTQTKNSLDLAHYFLVETQVHVQKQTKIKMNDFHSPKLGGGGRRLQSF